MHIIKGCPEGKWAEVQAIQREPFIFIMGNSRGRAEDDLAALLDRLRTIPLDPSIETYGEFITINPCQAVNNPDWTCGRNSMVTQWIDGPRFYAVEPVVRFGGSFWGSSHSFNIDTNDTETIRQLTVAIADNQASAMYTKAREECRQKVRGRTCQC